MSNERINDGGPAFPCEGEGFGNPKHHTPGMTLREHFAGQALAGIASRPFVPDRMDCGVLCIGTRPDAQAKEAYELADAMVKGRNK